MSKKSILIIFGLFLLVSGSLFTQQNAQELRFGSIVSGNVRAQEEIWYRIRTTENCILVIETTGNTDTCLELFDSQINNIRRDDDSGEGNNARIETLAPAGSTYLILLYSFDTGGPFRIMASYSPLTDAVELRVGSALSGNLNYGQRQLYTVRTAQAGLYTVETTGNVDTYLEAYDAAFKYIGYNDDGDNYNARLDFFAEANKIYYFMLSGYDDNEAGPYRISTSYEAVNAGNNTSRPTAAALRLGEAIPVFLTIDSRSRWYVYQATRAVTFIVQTRGDVDTILYLYDSYGNLLEEDDDSAGEGYNAYISTRLNTGTYYIEVKGYESSTGRCTLHAEIR